MIAIAIELLVSWFLLKYFCHRDLKVLGFYAKSKPLFLSLVVPMFYLFILYLGIAYLVENPYKFNPHYTPENFFQSLYYVSKAVVFEELIFRGALLYILVNRYGKTRAAFIAAVAFGVYHWFSYGIIGHLFEMLTVFISTAIIGYLLACICIKTGKIIFPIALHFAYNFTTMVVFSKEKNIGQQLLVKAHAVDPVRPEGIFPLFVIIIYYVGFPVLCYIFLKSLKNTNDWS